MKEHEMKCGSCGSKTHKSHEHKGKKVSAKHKALVHEKDEKHERMEKKHEDKE